MHSLNNIAINTDYQWTNVNFPVKVLFKYSKFYDPSYEHVIKWLRLRTLRYDSWVLQFDEDPHVSKKSSMIYTPRGVMWTKLMNESLLMAILLGENAILRYITIHFWYITIFLQCIAILLHYITIPFTILLWYHKSIAKSILIYCN